MKTQHSQNIIKSEKLKSKTKHPFPLGNFMGGWRGAGGGGVGGKFSALSMVLDMLALDSLKALFVTRDEEKKKQNAF